MSGAVFALARATGYDQVSGIGAMLVNPFASLL
jgi:hypothetical protein